MTPRQIDKRRLRALAPSEPARGMQQIGTAPGSPSPPPPRLGVTHSPPPGHRPPLRGMPPRRVRHPPGRPVPRRSGLAMPAGLGESSLFVCLLAGLEKKEEKAGSEQEEFSAEPFEEAAG